MKEAMFYSGMPGKAVRCHLCPRMCVIPDGKTGFCSVRLNQAGKLYSLVYRRLCSMAVDPIEKKPLYHFAPGSSCLSVCTVGCNLDCSFCQNWEISRMGKDSPLPETLGDNIPPERIVETAISRGVEGIAYTYTEPTVFFEYALDTMKLARRAGLYNVWVSNGFTNPEPAMEASRYLDAINIDIKGSDSFYRKLCNAPGEAPVRKAAMLYREQGVWVEITTLVIPGYNDSPKTLAGISSWVRNNLGPETPLHFSRFHPDFRLREPEPTPTSTLERACRIARDSGLQHVYIGNVPGHDSATTRCPECGKTLIERTALEISAMRDTLRGIPSGAQAPRGARAGTPQGTSTCTCGHALPLAGMKWSRLK